MTSKTHDLISFASLLTVAAYYPPAHLNISTAITCLVGNVIGSLLPDLDQATNRLWDLLPAGNFFGRIFRHIFLQHRTLSHSLLGIYLFYKFLLFALPKMLNPSIDYILVTYAILIGLVSHIASDMLTRDGVPLFFPFPFNIGFPPFKSLRITTGKFVENFLIFPGVTVYIFWFIYNHQSALLDLVKLIQS